VPNVEADTGRTGLHPLRGADPRSTTWAVIGEIEQAIGHVFADLEQLEDAAATQEQAARERRIALAALGTRMADASRLAGELEAALLAGGEDAALLIVARVRGIIGAVAGELPRPLAAFGHSHSDADEPAASPAPSPSAGTSAFFDPEVIFEVLPPPPRSDPGSGSGSGARSGPPHAAGGTYQPRPADPWRYSRPPARQPPVARAEPTPVADRPTSPQPRPQRGPAVRQRPRPIDWLVRRVKGARRLAPGRTTPEPTKAGART
jgi:hypothetical protein